MYILHAGKHQEGIAIWAEVSDREEDDPDAISPKQTVRYGKVVVVGGKRTTSRRCEFAASRKRLRAILKSIGIRAKNAIEADAYIPTRDGAPVPSSELITSAKEEDESIAAGLKDYEAYGTTSDENDTPTVKTLDTQTSQASIEKYAIETVNIPYKDVITLLRHVIDKRTLGPGMLIGADLAYLTDVMRLAGSIVARQQYIPDVTSDADYHAVWNPVLTGKDYERFEALAKGMPGAVRAFSHAGSQTESSPYVLLQILTRMINHVIRMSMPDEAKARGRQRRKFDSIHDAWIHYLKSTKPNPLADPNVLQFVDQVREWQRPVMTLAESPLRLCFRLEEPSGDGRGKAGTLWSVRYLLQPHDDPSLLIPAEDAWNDSHPELADNQTIKEFLLMSLGQASAIFSGIEEGMSNQNKGSGLGGCMLTSDGAYKFLIEEATALEQAGYVVMLPAWWTGKGTRTGITARANIRAPKLKASTGILNLSTIVQFDWSVAINDSNVTIDELEKLAAAKSSLVNVRGEWMMVEPDDIKQAIKFMKKKTGKLSFRDAIKMNLGIGGTGPAAEAMNKDGSTLDVTVDSEDGDIHEVLKNLSKDANIGDMEQPDGFVGDLRPYQRRGFSWMSFLQRWGLGGCLADDMGLGKTIQTLALVQQYRLNGGTKPFLLVCPTSVITNWQREAAKFTPDVPIVVHHGSDRATNAKFKKRIADCGMVISSYGLLHRDIKFIKQVEWGGVVLDEAQNIKNSQTKQSQASRMLNSESRFALTGTPVENNVGDLWAIMEFLNPGFLGSQAQFKDRFFLPIQSMQDDHAAKKLKQATGPFILRRLKTDKTIITDLPEKTETKAYCKLTKEQASLYEAVVNEITNAIINSEGIQRRGIILSSLAKLKQICDHPAIFLKDNSKITTHGASSHERSGKLARLVEMLTEVVDAGDSALVFTQFVGMGHVIRRHLQETFGIEVLFLHGGVSRKKRDEMVQRFQNGHGSRLFVISLKAGGTGLNLTVASHVFHFDRWWNPAVEDQATDRAFRIGQKMNVQVHKMICEGTLEEKIDDMIERKKEISRSVIGSGESWLTEMSNEDLRDVLALSADAAMDTNGEGKTGRKTRRGRGGA